MEIKRRIIISKKIIVIAGNYRQFDERCKEMLEKDVEDIGIIDWDYKHPEREQLYVS